MGQKKRNLIASGIALAVVAGAGFGYQHVSADDDLNLPKDTEVTVNDAVDQAQNEQAGTVTGLELESKNGNAYYEVEIEDDKTEYDLIVNANDGTVQKKNDEDDDDNETIPQAELSIKAAAEAALAEIGGTLKEISLDEEDGTIVYEAEIITDSDEVELTLDANTGEILQKDTEALEDDD